MISNQRISARIQIPVRSESGRVFAFFRRVGSLYKRRTIGYNDRASQGNRRLRRERGAAARGKRGQRMQQEVTVSVIVPVYNCEKYLRQFMDSIVAQTLREIEIICVDDGSTDGSLALLREYAARDSRITVLSQENRGAGSARNARP